VQRLSEERYTVKNRETVKQIQKECLWERQNNGDDFVIRQFILVEVTVDDDDDDNELLLSCTTFPVLPILLAHS
jgi:hypothetical protein